MLVVLKRNFLWALAAASLLLMACEGDRPMGGDGGAMAEFTEACGVSGDCLSGLCLEIAADRAFCTRGCATDADCPDSGNWGCVQPDRFGARVCGCVPDATEEICGDGLDNDCDGATDDCRICDG
ncbi:MAG: hypothetical protein RID93_00280, partial [Sandaracinaceae bacterium]